MEEQQKSASEVLMDEKVKSEEMIAEEIIVNGIDALQFVEPAESREQKETPEDLVEEFLNDSSKAAEDQVKNEKLKEESLQFLGEAVELNADELYLETLSELVLAPGYKDESGVQYLQRAFGVSNEKHEMLLEKARSKTPKILLHVEIIEATDIPPKDGNGLRDLFCTLYLTSDTSHRKNTSVKEQTLHPVWGESFTLSLADPCEDCFCVEVWEFNPEGSILEKFSKITNVTSAACVPSFFKGMGELVLSAYMDKQNNQFIGCAEVELKTISLTEPMMWLKFEEENSSKYNGAVNVKLVVSTDKDAKVAMMQYRQLMWVFTMHEIKQLKSHGSKAWSGQFSDAGDKILQQYIVQNRMGKKDVFLAQWDVYAEILLFMSDINATFSFKMQDMDGPISNTFFSEEEVITFIDAADKILVSCYETVKTMWQLPATEETREHIENTLSNLSLVNSMKFLKEGDSKNPRPSSKDICSVVREMIVQAANDWYDHITEQTKLKDTSEMSNLRHKTQILRVMKENLESQIQFMGQLFERQLEVPYGRMMFTALDSRIQDMTEPVVNEICSRIRNTYKEKNLTVLKQNDNFELGRSLFELYKEVQGIGNLGTAIFGSEFESLGISKYHSWFYPAVSHWFDIVKYDVMRLEDRAEDKEKLDLTNTKDIFSSVADNMDVYFQKIEDFWTELSWPYSEQSFELVIMVLDEIFETSDRYVDRMIWGISKTGGSQNESQTFYVTKEWCLTINKIDYLIRQIQQFTEELALEKILKSIAETNNSKKANPNLVTSQQTIGRGVTALRDQLSYVVDTVVEKMNPFLLLSMKKCTDSTNRKDMDNLTKYLDDNFEILKSNISLEHLKRIQAKTFQNLLTYIDKAIKIGLQKRKPPVYFSSLCKTLTMLRDYFGRNEEFQISNELLSKTEGQLGFLAMSTPDIIMEVHSTRLKEQNNMTSAALGTLSVKLWFVKETLYIDILKANDLIPLDSNGSSDPYVRVKMLPEELFANVKIPKTKVVSRNLCPVFGETFTIQLADGLRHVKDGMLLFMVKDQDLAGLSSDFLGEAYVSLSEIPEFTESIMEETQLKLSVPSQTSLDCEFMKVLNHRKEDKLANTFVKQQNSKHTHGHVAT